MGRAPRTGIPSPAAPARWLAPFWVSLPLLLLVGLSLAFLRTRTVRAHRAAQAEAVTSARQAMGFRLVGIQQYLMLLADERARDRLAPGAFRDAASRYVDLRPELIWITWVEADLSVAHVAPEEPHRSLIGLHLNLPDQIAAAEAARASGRPVFTPPFESPIGGPAFEIWAPVLANGNSQGYFAGHFLFRELLTPVLSLPALAGNNYRLIGPEGQTFAQGGTATNGRGDLITSETLELPVGGVRLELSEDLPPWWDWPTLSIILATALLVVGMGASLGLLRRDHARLVGAQAALAASEAKYADLYDNAPDMFFSLDAATGRILECNQTLADRLGYTKEELIGRRGIEVYQGASARQARQAFRDFLREGELHDVELELRTRTGEKVEVSLNVSAVRDAEGRILYSRSVCRDITERKAIERQLRDRAELQAILIALSTRFINLAPEAIDAGIQATLAEIGRFAGVDRSYIFLFRHGHDRMDNTHEWCAPGVSAQIANLQDLRPAEELPWFTPRTLAGEVVHVPRVADLPPEASLEKRHFEAQDIQSLITVPLISRGAVIGFVGFDAVTAVKAWSDEHIALLRIVGDMFVQMLERKRAETALREAEAWLRQAVRGSRIGLWDWRPGRGDVTYSPEWGELIGESHLRPSLEEWEGRLHPEERPRVMARLRAAAENPARPYADEFRLRHADGDYRWVLGYGEALTDDRGAVERIVGSLIDVTERRRAEEERRAFEAQLQQAQKLESLGVLAGGIAHDFNNLLLGVLGNADLALMDLSPTAPGRNYVQDIVKIAQRASDLCRQMLAYSGRGKFMIQPLDVNAVIQDMTHLLELSISKKAIIKYQLAHNLPAIEADATQLRQVIMNLITNASEAIGERSGVIALTTGAMQCDWRYLVDTFVGEELPPGLYVFLEVADNGVGMDEETRKRIFDPFFTTKFTGRGLGLAAVIGIVRGHRGTIKVYSEAGRGSSFKVLFPSSQQPALPIAGEAAPAVAWSGSGTILLVDDEETILAVSQDILERSGFRVLCAADGRSALDFFFAHRDEIRLVILDMTMPHMSGEETFRELRRLKPDVKVLLSSGYNEQEATHRFSGKGLAGFIQKPYRASELLERIRIVLEGPGPQV